jgi:hypothetical protein
MAVRLWANNVQYSCPMCVIEWSPSNFIEEMLTDLEHADK